MTDKICGSCMYWDENVCKCPECDCLGCMTDAKYGCEYWKVRFKEAE